MLNRMALGDSGRLGSETTYEPGNQIFLRVPSEDPNLTLDVVTPQKQTLNVRAVTGPDKPSWSFLQTIHEGLYRWHSVDKRHTGQFVVNPPAEEVDLLPTDLEALAKEPESKTPRPVIIASTVAQLADQLDKQATGTSLAPGVLALVIIMTLLEALLANRYKPALRTTTTILPQPHPDTPQPTRHAA